MDRFEVILAIHDLLDFIGFDRGFGHEVDGTVPRNDDVVLESDTEFSSGM